MARFTLRLYSDFGMTPQDETRILFESDDLTAVKKYIKDYFSCEDYFNAVYFVDNKLNKSGYVGRDLTICDENLEHFCEMPDEIKMTETNGLETLGEVKSILYEELTFKEDVENLIIPIEKELKAYKCLNDKIDKLYDLVVVQRKMLTPELQIEVFSKLRDLSKGEQR